MHIAISKPIHTATGTITLHVTQTVPQGAFIVLMGESGAGKSTFLRIVAGLEEASGTIKLDDKEVWLSNTSFLPVQRRSIGFVFQNFALFEHMSVLQNLLYVREDTALANRLLERLEIATLAMRKAAHLSGGQKQRVALARALMRKPRVLLLDEPLSSLDPRIRRKSAMLIKELHRSFGMTTFMVSHHVDEAKWLADEIWLLEKGRVRSYAPDTFEV